MIVCENSEIKAEVFKLDRYWYWNIEYKKVKRWPQTSNRCFTKEKALNSLKSMPRVKDCLKKRKMRKK